MYKNIGEKIKSIITILTAISFVILFIVAIMGLVSSNGESNIFIVCALAALGIWLTNLVAYAIGQITENTDKIVENQKIIIEYLESKDNKSSNESLPKL
jgi:membrane protein DedA with SNARE-associated domain